jgi:uncharacterized protein YndB with AHSA1/START domain
MTSETRAVVRVSHKFSLPPERVLDGWLNPEIARKWLFATPTGQIVRVDIDARVGGSFVIVDRRDGEDVEHCGKYIEIDRPRLLVFALVVPMISTEESKVTIEIATTGNGCELSLVHEGVFPEYVEPCQSGWGALLKALEANA